MEIMKRRGARRPRPKGLKADGGEPTAEDEGSFVPLQIFAEGDFLVRLSGPVFRRQYHPAIERRLGVPILNLAKAGDEARYMLGVEERAILTEHLTNGCPAGGPRRVKFVVPGAGLRRQCALPVDERHLRAGQGRQHGGELLKPLCDRSPGPLGHVTHRGDRATAAFARQCKQFGVGSGRHGEPFGRTATALFSPNTGPPTSRIDGNPLENINLIADPAKNFKVIMKDGKVYKNTLGG